MARVAETEIGRVVVSWLEADGWDVWQEVGVGTTSGVCDIVGKRGPVVHAIECKAVANLGVLEQASGWVRQAHFVSVAVPQPRRDRLYAQLAKSIGVGVIWVSDKYRGNGESGLGVDLWQQGPMTRIRNERFYPPLSDSLTPERKSWPAEAGNNLGHRYTPFRETCERLRKVVMEQPGITMRVAVERLRNHHYNDDKAARAALSQWARMGRIKGIRVEPGARAMLLYPEARNGHGEGCVSSVVKGDRT